MQSVVRCRAAAGGFRPFFRVNRAADALAIFPHLLQGSPGLGEHATGGRLIRGATAKKAHGTVGELQEACSSRGDRYENEMIAMYMYGKRLLCA